MVDRGWSVYLCGSSVKGTWREGSLAGDPQGYIYKRFWRRESPSTGAPFGEPGGGFVNWGLWELDEGALEMEHHSSNRLHGEGLGGGGLLHWRPWNICYVSLLIWAALYGGPLSIWGEPGMWGGGSYTRDFDRWMKEGSSSGATLCEGFNQGDLEGELRYRGTQKMRFLRDAKCPVNGPPSP